MNTTTKSDLLQQLQEQAPQEVLTSILSYAGPGAVVAAAKLNGSWRRAAHDEATYQALCEALGKQHNPLTRPPPPLRKRSSWCDLYRENIFVPEDCSTLPLAVRFARHQFQAAAARGVTGKRVTIWLQPSTAYSLEETLVVNVVGHNACLCLATRRTTVTVEDAMDMEEDDRTNNNNNNTSMMMIEDDQSSTSSTDTCRTSRPPSDSVAMLFMETKHCNRPLLCLEQGTLELRDLAVEHFSEVHLMQLMTHKNENAAILLKSPTQEQPSNLSLILNSVSLRSYSGKGVLNRQGGKVTLSDSFVARTWS